MPSGSVTTGNIAVFADATGRRIKDGGTPVYSQDFSGTGFEWIDHDDARRSLLSFVRKGVDGQLILVLCNFAPVVHHGFRLGVPAPGQWQERLNTDSAYYGGSNVGTPLGAATAEAVPSHGRAHSVVLTVPPLASVFLDWPA
jgi:1,4-alpha-glucan branching enzyme